MVLLIRWCDGTSITCENWKEIQHKIETQTKEIYKKFDWKRIVLLREENEYFKVTTENDDINGDIYWINIDFIEQEIKELQNKKLNCIYNERKGILQCLNGIKMIFDLFDIDDNKIKEAKEFIKGYIKLIGISHISLKEITRPSDQQKEILFLIIRNCKSKQLEYNVLVEWFNTITSKNDYLLEWYKYWVYCRKLKMYLSSFLEALENNS